jgi:hypothetical protein
MKIYAFRTYVLASKNISENASLYEFTAGRGYFELLRHPFWGAFLSKRGNKYSLSYASYKSLKTTILNALTPSEFQK